MPNELGYFEFLHKCEAMIEHLIKAFKAQLLFAMPALTEALHMSEKELQKKLSHICSTPNPKPHGGGAEAFNLREVEVEEEEEPETR